MELARLRIRVIAPEMIATLARALTKQLYPTHNMSACPGYSHHALTLSAAEQMLDLVRRSAAFREDSRLLVAAVRSLRGWTDMAA